MAAPKADVARAFVGLGGNLGDPAAAIGTALARLDALPQTRLVAHSRLYRSPAWGPIAQPDYVNAVAELSSTLAPAGLMQALLELERSAGRERRERWGPRVLDLDLLLYDDLERRDATLELPHPRLHERAFVLLPLAELAPALVVPGRGPVRQLLDSVDCSTTEALG